jgi:putative flippase GtrA
MKPNELVRKLFLHETSHGLIQLIRYCFVVVIAAPIDLGGYILLKSTFHVYYVLAATASFTASLIVNYLLSVAWVWTNQTGRRRRTDATIFAIIGVVGLGLTDLIVYLFTEYAHFNYIISKLIAFIIVFFWSFGARRWLFAKKTDDLMLTRLG